MNKLTLIGIDPGIVDTGMVTIRLDFENKKWWVISDVFEDVTSQDKGLITIHQGFLDDIASMYQDEQHISDVVWAGVEGYRQRGMNQKQDQNMIELVQVIARTLPGSQIVDNTGIKKIVTEDMLKLFKANRFKGTNHADLKSAARVAIAVGIRQPSLNKALCDFLEDNLFEEGTAWEHVSM